MWTEYTPDDDYNGSDSFTYEIKDINGTIYTGTVNVTVTPEVDITANTFTVDEDSSSNVLTVLANDTFEGTPVVSVSGASANGGTLSTDGTPVIYTSAANYSGTDTFTYTVTSVV